MIVVYLLAELSWRTELLRVILVIRRGLYSLKREEYSKSVELRLAVLLVRARLSNKIVVVLNESKNEVKRRPKRLRIWTF